MVHDQIGTPAALLFLGACAVGYVLGACVCGYVYGRGRRRPPPAG